MDVSFNTFVHIINLERTPVSFGHGVFLLLGENLKRMSKELYRACAPGTLDKKINILSNEEILKEMGFPINWRDLNSL